MLHVINEVPRPDALLGLVWADGLDVAALPAGFEEQLTALLARRRLPLTAAEEAVRAAARDLLRNGVYKPTGRGKPASEYLVRAAQEPERGFPRINAPVDVCNFMSLQTLLPISLWDLDRAGTHRFRFRLGRPGEAYVFNRADQVIKLEDLLVGCRLGPEAAADVPIVNAVKDSLATKTTPATRRVAACLYTPSTAVDEAALAGFCQTFAALLAGCGTGVAVGAGVVVPGTARDL